MVISALRCPIPENTEASSALEFELSVDASAVTKKSSFVASVSNTESRAERTRLLDIDKGTEAWLDASAGSKNSTEFARDSP